MSSKNILQNEKDTKMFSDILKVFNYQLKCTTKKIQKEILQTQGKQFQMQMCP